MDWTTIILTILGLFTVEGAGYLVLNKKVTSKAELQEVEKAKEENKREDISTGLEALGFYKEIDELIKQHTDPLNDKIDELTKKVNKWCCYRNCELRLKDEEKAKDEISITIEELVELQKSRAHHEA